ncbi:MAG TPA: LuxR C-terminal-related transcriptional regulator [Hyphomicrobiaceae bacterium]|jgi:DNA-binding CsgD family transcriptional regulator/PAS domain-containing protein|nr:LuxR C-terminal-related transcriptional regulator [Hyphomicrobiaceae bacterium]
MIDISGISAQALSDAIGAIYDCALEPDHWPEAMRRITELTGSVAMGMGIIDHKHKQNVRLYDYGYSEEDMRIYFEKYAAMNPAFVARLMYPVGEPVTSEMLIGEQELFESRIYQEYWKPRGFRYGATIELLRTVHRSAGTAVVRKEGQTAYGAADLALLRLLAPHLIRAVTISDVLDLRTLKSEMLEATLDGLAAGVYLTTRDGRIVYMNAAAERQLRTGNALRVVNNSLSAADPRARPALAKAIDEAATCAADAGPGGHALAIPDTDGAGYVATLLPLERGRRQSIIAPFAASVAVFTQNPSAVPLMPGEAFAKLYKLTGGELRVLLALARGVGAKEAADSLGISEATVRTHLQQMFSKTGTSRQADLLRLLQSSAPPTKADQLA